LWQWSGDVDIEEQIAWAEALNKTMREYGRATLGVPEMAEAILKSIHRIPALLRVVEAARLLSHELDTNDLPNEGDLRLGKLNTELRVLAALDASEQKETPHA